MFSHHLGGRVTIQRLGCGIPGSNRAIKGLPDYRVVAALNDRGQQRADFFELPAAAPFFSRAQFARHRRIEPRKIALHHVVMNAGPHHINGQLFTHRARHADKGNVQPALLVDFQCFNAAKLRQRVIADDQVPFF